MNGITCMAEGDVGELETANRLQQTDAELVALTLSGDSSAFDELTERYARIISSYVLSRVRDPELARELVQETLLDAYAGIQKLRDHRRFSSWIIQIAHYKVSDHFHAQQREHRFMLPEVRLGAPGELADWPDSPTERISVRLEREEVIQLVHKEIQKMRPKVQAVLLLYLFDELTAVSIAQRLSLKESTVRMRLLRGLEVLRKQLERSSLILTRSDS